MRKPRVNQEFISGNSVKIGFMTLTVVRQSTRSNEWLLVSSKGVHYSFTPYNGLFKLNSVEDFR